MKSKLLLSIFSLILLFGCSTSNEDIISVVSTPEVVTPIPTVLPTLTDIDGNKYQTIKIYNQIWTKTNLNVSRYSNGDLIPQVSDSDTWSSLTTGAWCYYLNTSGYGPVYGKLYNWYAIVDPRGLAPKGYHIPSDIEWTTLTDYLGGESIAGGKMKEIGNSHWKTPNKDANNSSEFTGTPGGYRLNDGKFYSINEFGYWWSSSEYSSRYALFHRLDYYNGDLGRFNYLETIGLSVRCIKD